MTVHLGRGERGGDRRAGGRGRRASVPARVCPARRRCSASTAPCMGTGSAHVLRAQRRGAAARRLGRSCRTGGRGRAAGPPRRCSRLDRSRSSGFASANATACFSPNRAQVPESDAAGLGIWQKLMVHAGERARHRGRPLYLELVRRLREENASGATALRGILGSRATTHPAGTAALSFAPPCARPDDRRRHARLRAARWFASSTS